MIQYTTPTFRLTISGADLSNARELVVTIRQGERKFDLSGDALVVTGNAHNVIECYLTQEQSMKLAAPAPARIQVNWSYLDVDFTTIRRAATRWKEFSVDENLLKRAMT